MLLLLVVTGLATLAHAATLTEPPFTIHHHESEAEVAQESLEILQAATEEFDVHLPLGEEVVTVHIAHTIKEFRSYAPSLAQLNIAGLADSKAGLIVVKSPSLSHYDSDYRGTLRHELVHILLYRNVDTTHLPRWLNEGLSMSLANELRWQSAWVVGRQFMQGRIIDYHELDHRFREPGSETQFGDAYAQALSLTRFYRNTLGEDTFWQVIHAMDTLSLDEALRAHSKFTEMELWGMYQSSLWQWLWVSTLSSGSIFIPAALLLVIAYFRKRRQGKKIMARWEVEERRPPRLMLWDDFEEDGEAWKHGTEYEDDSDPYC